jgi:hypothetical protein
MDHAPDLDLPTSHRAVAGIHTIRSDALLPMLDWTAGRPHEGYRRLETRLDPGITERLEDTLGLLEAGALYDALQAEISLFGDLCGPLFERVGSTCDTVPGEEIKEEMVRRWNSHRAQVPRKGLVLLRLDLAGGLSPSTTLQALST